MASVVFIIRVPYESLKKNADHVGNKNEEREISKETDDQNAEKVTFEKSDNTTIVKSTDQKEASDSTHTDEVTLAVEPFTAPLDLAEVLQNELRSLNVNGDAWSITNDKQFYQVIFLEQTGERVEKILGKLTMVGIGKRSNSSVSIISTSVHIQSEENEIVTEKTVSQSENIMNHEETDALPLLVKEESIKDQLKNSIKSRLTVEQVVVSVRMQALLTFDYVMFTILASIIAAVGLVEDNAVVLVASMLVSPLMGPILGGTFGTVIKNKGLRNTGLKAELCGLILAVLVGFLFGCICGPFGASWNTKKGTWPTQEMTSRGMDRGLWVGAVVALPSGAGVALSVLGGNTASLVGVAISASLLVPAVNSWHGCFISLEILIGMSWPGSAAVMMGMLWAYAIISTIKPPEVNTSMNLTFSKCAPFKDNSYIPTYSCDMGTEAAIMGIISLVLTIVNIICILIAATIVLKIKEVTPKASSSNATQTFWTKDIKVAREAYETLKGDQASSLLKEWKKVLRGRSRDGRRNSRQEDEELLNIIKEVERTEEFEAVVARTPTGTQNLNTFSRQFKKLVSRDGEETSTADKEAMDLQNQLRNLQTYYSLRAPQDKAQVQPHVETIFSEPETKPEQRVREFHVVETEKPHYTSVVRVRPPSHSADTYNVKTESGL